MQRMVKYIVRFELLLLVLLYLFIPDKRDIFQLTELFFFLPFLFHLFIPQFFKQGINISGRINLGLIYFGTMIVILIVGNISNYVIKFVYPLYDVNIRATNLYYLAGVLFFLIGFFWKVRKVNGSRTNKYFLPVSLKATNLFVFLSLFSIIVATAYIGYIPFLQGRGGGERFLNFASSSIYIRLWSLSVVAAVFSFTYIIYYKRNFLVIAVFFSSILISLYYIIRMYPFLIAVTVFIIWFESFQSIKKKLTYSAIGLSLFFLINMIFVDYRERGRNINAVRTEERLNFIQKNLFYTTFNEYGQLKTAVNTYKGEPQYGKTFLSIPVGFIPAPFLSPFGVVKSDIQENNSAIIMAKYLGSKNSIGIRIGLMGELFINFKFLGCVFMVFVGLIVGFIQNKLNSLNIKDFRYGMYLIIFTILLYALIGQIDAIGSLLGFYILLFFLLKLFIRKRIKAKEVL